VAAPAARRYSKAEGVHAAVPDETRKRWGPEQGARRDKKTMQRTLIIPESHAAPAARVPRFEGAAHAAFDAHYNRASFLFSHALHENPLFELPQLLALAARRPAEPLFAYWSNGRVGVAQRWDTKVAPRRSLTDTVAHIEDNDSLVLLKHVERDAVLGPAVRAICEQVVELSGPQMRADVLEARGTLLIASPGRLTSYHLDADVNFLFQIAGDKWLSVFDQADRTLTSHEELERYYDGDPNGAVFKEHRQPEARRYDLRAGLGVHIPSMAPHWAENRERPSVALSINFDLRSVGRLGRIYHFNCKLRRHGIHPRPPGASVWRDSLKLAALSGLGAAQRMVKRAPQGAAARKG
jgi:hypothetical protein